MVVHRFVRRGYVPRDIRTPCARPTSSSMRRPCASTAERIRWLEGQCRSRGVLRGAWGTAAASRAFRRSTTIGQSPMGSISGRRGRGWRRSPPLAAVDWTLVHTHARAEWEVATCGEQHPSDQHSAPGRSHRIAPCERRGSTFRGDRSATAGRWEVRTQRCDVHDSLTISARPPLSSTVVGHGLLPGASGLPVTRTGPEPC